MDKPVRDESAIRKIKRSLLLIMLVITLIQLVGYGLLISRAIEAYRHVQLTDTVDQINRLLMQSADGVALESQQYQAWLTGRVLPAPAQRLSWQRQAALAEAGYGQALSLWLARPALADRARLLRLQTSLAHMQSLRLTIWQRLAGAAPLPDETLSFELMLASERLLSPSWQIANQLRRKMSGDVDEETARLQSLQLSLWQIHQRVQSDQTARLARHQLGHPLNDTMEAGQEINRQLAANVLSQLQEDLPSLPPVAGGWQGGELAQAFQVFMTRSHDMPPSGVADTGYVQSVVALTNVLQHLRQQADRLLQQHIARQSAGAVNALMGHLLILLLAILLNAVLFLWLLRRVLRPLDLFSAVQDAAREAIMLVNPAGRLFMANRGAQSLFALSEAQLTACYLQELISEPGLDHRRLLQLAESGQEIETQARGGNAQPLHISLIASRIRLGGLLQGVLVIVRDDQQRFHAEQARQYSLRLLSDVSRLQNLLFTPILREAIFDELLAVLQRYAGSEGGVLLETRGLHQAVMYRCRASAGPTGVTRDQRGPLSELQAGWRADARWHVYPVSLQQGTGGIIALWGPDVKALHGSDDALLALYVSLLGFVLEEEARKQSSERLGQVMRELDGIFKASPAGLILLDDRNRLLKVNHPVCQMLGVEASALVLGDLALLLGESEQWPALQQQIEHVRSGVPAQRCELACRARSHDEVWLLFESRLLHDGHPADGVILSCTDITTIKRNELALREARDSAAQARHRLGAAIEALPEAFAFYDVEDLLIICNQQYTDLFFDGIAADQVVGESFESLVRLSMMRADEQTEPGYTPEGWLAERVRRHRLPEASFVLQIGTRWYMANDRQIPGLGTVCLRADITELKSQQQALEVAREQADQANAAKSAFLATISHEIRTPLNGILGLLELLRLGESDAQRLDSLTSVQTSAHTLLRLIDDILDFSKIEAGRMQLSPEAVDLVALLRSVHALYRETAERKSLQYRLELPATLAPAYEVDPLRLRQILQNFLSNAVKFTEQGQVLLCLEVLAGDDHSQTLRFSCRDSGIGIAPEQQAQLFQPFTQAESSTTRRFGGTGLGLAICRRLAGLMAGEVAMQSRPGEGTAISLTLRLRLADAARIHSMAVAPAIDTALAFDLPAPLLVVEDNPVNRKLIAMQLERLGIPCLLAEDGRQALDCWLAQRVSLILTDCHMPVMDGLQLAREVRQVEAMRASPSRIPILACTADVASDALPQALASGIDEVLGKPLGLQVLQQALARWLPTRQLAMADGVAASVVPPPEGAAGGVIDRQVLAMYSQGDAAIEADLIRDFLDSEADDWQALQQAVHEQLPERVRWYAHRLKGAARMVGAMALGEAAQRLEQESERPAQLAGALVPVAQAWQAVAAWLGAQAPAPEGR
ncbi:hypothetical protein THUN1379_07980 [Paludibacterium sp. THUN1379]|uniref:ATP-binding protein n=1 Tax=Paludibacterium sp. THUN1379 TaxID=3112107 RepID=UPI00308B8B3F|nr:hypothetical protein THUN1379_07980 [Paludibacterium sp. THUN1379]